MEPLKNLYSKKFFTEFGLVLEKVVSGFDSKKFLKKIFVKDWDKKELKERMYHISNVLDEFYSSDFTIAADEIILSCSTLRANGFEDKGLELMFFPDYIEKFGIKHFGASMKAMESITELSSCEFAIRPFIIDQPVKTMKKLLRWSKHKNHHVRRLASEGSRPRLPWALALPEFKQDPSPVLPILENLKNDPSEYVRRSVANNLNDISKDHPEVLISTIKKWKDISPETNALIKHASRTLLKAGDKRIFSFYGLDTKGIEVKDLKMLTSTVKVGGKMEFGFELKNIGKKDKHIRLEYGIHFLLKNGKHNQKVFKITEKSFAPQSFETITRNHSFKIISTRTYYAGEHHVSLIINGQEQGKLSFEVKL